MNIPREYQDVIDFYGFTDRMSYAEEAFSRNIGILDAGDVARLTEATVAVAGMGGVGGNHLISMARCGVGRFKVADMDAFEPANINRQYGANAESFGRSKMDYMAGLARAVNPFVEIETFPEGVSEENVDAFLEGVDVVLDGLDFFVFDVRRMLFKRAQEKGIPVITAGPLGFSTAVLVFTPGGMGFDEYFAVDDDTEQTRKYLNFALALAPKALHTRYIDRTSIDFSTMKGPSLHVGCLMSAAVAATEALRLLLGRKGVKPVPYYIQIDPYLRRMVRGRLRKGNRSPVQRLKGWLFDTFFLKNVLREGSEPVRPVDAPAEGDPLTPGVREYLLRAAVQAPSGDNVQPWRFAFGPDHADVFAVPGADTSFFNIGQVATTVSCGAAIENMAVAATACGLAADVELLPDGGKGECMARLRFDRPGRVREDLLADSIWKRHTNRKPFKTRPIPDAIWKRLGDIAAGQPGAKLDWINTPEALRRLSAAIFTADRIRVERRDLHEYFTGMVRFAPGEAEASRDGLPLKNLEAGAAGDLFLKATRPWSRMRVANAVGLGRVVAVASMQGIRKSGGAALLAMDGDSTADYLRGGRALERVWLTLAHYNLRMQPMTAVTLFRLRWLMEGPEAFSPRHRDMLAGVWTELGALFPDAWARRGLVMLFRAGFGPVIKHGTYRRESQSFLR